MSAYVVVLGSVKSRLPKRCKITSLFTPFFMIWRNGDKKACYLHRFQGQTDGVHIIWFRINVLDRTKCIWGGFLFRINVLIGTKQQIRSPPEQNREGRTEMLRFFPAPMLLIRRTMKCKSTWIFRWALILARTEARHTNDHKRRRRPGIWATSCRFVSTSWRDFSSSITTRYHN